MEILDIVKTAVRAIDSKQGLDTEVIRITDLTVLADYFVIATATSSTQLRAMGDEVEYKLSQAGVETTWRARPPAGCAWTTARWSFTCWSASSGITTSWSVCGATAKNRILQVYWRQNNGV